VFNIYDMIKKFFEFISESVSMKPEWSEIIRNTPELSNLVSKRKIELKENELIFDIDDTETTEILNIYLGIELPKK
jgi:hypothetical protein